MFNRSESLYERPQFVAFKHQTKWGKHWRVVPANEWNAIKHTCIIKVGEITRIDGNEHRIANRLVELGVTPYNVTFTKNLPARVKDAYLDVLRTNRIRRNEKNPPVAPYTLFDGKKNGVKYKWFVAFDYRDGYWKRIALFHPQTATNKTSNRWKAAPVGLMGIMEIMATRQSWDSMDAVVHAFKNNRSLVQDITYEFDDE